MNTNHDHNVRHQTAGALAMFAGIGLLALVLLDATYFLPWDMPRTWYVHRTLWGMIALVLAGAGWALQRPRSGHVAGWTANPPGRRFRKLVIYSRSECHLCDDAKAVLASYLEYLPDIEEVDIDSDPELMSRFDTSVPVVELDGQVRFRGRVDEVLFRRLIEGTPPIV